MPDFKIVTDEAGIEGLAGEWRRLHARVGRSAFIDYDLFMAWWRTLGKSYGMQSLRVVTVRRDGALAGVLPLLAVRRKGLRILLAAGHKGNYYCDMLAEDRDTALALWQAARQNLDYDFADIRDVYPGSMCYEALSSFARRRDVTGAYYVQLGYSSGQDWIAKLSGNVRGKFRRCTRRLEEKAPLSYEVYEQGPLPAAIVDRMVKEKITWTIARKKSGLFDHPDVFEFFRQSLETAARQGRLFLAWLRCGDDIIAYNLGFIHRDTLHMSFWTHDPAWSQYSPGNVIMIHSICRAIERGLHTVELGQGGGFFKRQFSSETRSCDEFTFSGTPSGRLIEAAFIGSRGAWRLASRMKLEEGEPAQKEGAGTAG